MPHLDEIAYDDGLDPYASRFDGEDLFDRLEDADYLAGDPDEDEEAEVARVLDELSGDDEEEEETRELLEELAGEDEEIAGFFSSLGKVVKSVVKSPITKAVAAGASFVVPAVGVSASAALMAANKVVTSLDSKSPKRRKAAKRLVQNTHGSAKAGNRKARRGLRVLQVARRARRKQLRTLAGSLRARRRVRKASPRRIQAVQAQQARKLRDCQRRLKRLEKAKAQRPKLQSPKLQRVKGVMVTDSGAVLRGKWYRGK